VILVAGGSMEPALTAGDLLVYRRGAAIEPGDLVLFEHRDSLVVHRVVSTLRGGRLRTRGDANDTLDAAPVDSDAVRGEVVLVVPSGTLVERVAALRH
jgi:signal peptidase I